LSSMSSVSLGQENDFRHLPLDAMEATIARFEERVSAAQQASPPTKDFVRRAVKRQGAARCPVRVKRFSFDVILRHGDALADLFGEFPDDAVFFGAYDPFVGRQPSSGKDRINPIDVLMHTAEWTDEWGTVWGHAFGGVGATPVNHPLKDWGQLDEYLAARIPDPLAEGRLDAARQTKQAVGDSKYCVGMIQLALFERLQAIRGMRETFIDFCSNEQEVHRLLRALVDYLVVLIRSWAELGVDAIFLTDDWGTQSSLMISPAMWRDYFKDHYRTLFDTIHRAGMDAILHSCGNVMGIVPDLIDLGLDALDPIQPGAMDMAEIARRFGGQIAFCGGVDVQHLLISGSPSDIRDGVRRLVETLARPFGNAMILAPANMVTPEVPLENLRALCEACHE
jgi:uroporphyrinogen decarboxylase